MTRKLYLCSIHGHSADCPFHSEKSLKYILIQLEQGLSTLERHNDWLRGSSQWIVVNRWPANDICIYRITPSKEPSTWDCSGTNSCILKHRIDYRNSIQLVWMRRHSSSLPQIHSSIRHQVGSSSAHFAASIGPAGSLGSRIVHSQLKRVFSSDGRWKPYESLQTLLFKYPTCLYIPCQIDKWYMREAGILSLFCHYAELKNSPPREWAKLGGRLRKSYESSDGRKDSIREIYDLCFYLSYRITVE